jgi:hypothetical protein
VLSAGGTAGYRLCGGRVAVRAPYRCLPARVDGLTAENLPYGSGSRGSTLGGCGKPAGFESGWGAPAYPITGLANERSQVRSTLTRGAPTKICGTSSTETWLGTGCRASSSPFIGWVGDGTGETITLDKLAADYFVPDLVKLDIEGGGSGGAEGRTRNARRLRQVVDRDAWSRGRKREAALEKLGTVFGRDDDGNRDYRRLPGRRPG